MKSYSVDPFETLSNLIDAIFETIKKTILNSGEALQI